jgi:hypothetical protein
MHRRNHEMQAAQMLVESPDIDPFEFRKVMYQFPMTAEELQSLADSLAEAATAVTAEIGRVSR